MYENIHKLMDERKMNDFYRVYLLTTEIAISIHIALSICGRYIPCCPLALNEHTKYVKQYNKKLM